MAVPDATAALMNLARDLHGVTEEFSRSVANFHGGNLGGLRQQPLEQVAGHRAWLLDVFLGHSHAGGGQRLTPFGYSAGGRGGYGTGGGSFGGAAGESANPSAWAANPIAAQLLRGGGVDAAKLSGLHAHLSGRGEMPKSLFVDLLRQAAGATDWRNKPAHSEAFLRQAAGAFNEARGGYGAKRSDPWATFLGGLNKAARGLRGFADQSTEGGRALAEFHEHVSAAGGMGKAAFKRGVVGMSLAAEAGAPDAFATLTGSMKLLMAHLGAELVPEIVTASSWLQRLAQRFHDADPGTRSLYKNVGLLAVAGAGFVALAPQIVALGTMAKAMGGGAVASGAWGFAKAHPVLAAGAAASAATLAGSLWLNRDLDARTGGLNADLEGNAAGLSPEELHKSDVYKQYAAIPSWAGRKQIIQSDARYNAALVDSFKDVHAYALGQTSGGSAPPAFGDTVRGMFNQVFNPGELDKHAAKVKELGARGDLINAAFQDLEGGGFKGGASSKAKDKQALLTAQGLLLDLQSRTQPAYFGVEEMHKQVQLQALGESPLEAEIRKIQLDSLEQLYKQSDILQKLLDKDYVATLG